MTRKPFQILAVLAAIGVLGTGAPAAHAAHAAFSRPVVHVGIVLFNGAEPIDYAGPYEVFAQAGFAVATVSADGKPVTGMGLRVAADYSFANAPKFDVLVVPGGSVSGAGKSPALLAFIRQRAAASRQVLTVCTGTFILAATGLLDGLQATTYTESLRTLADRYPRIHVISDARWVDNGKIITSAGLTTGIAAALHVVAKLDGTAIARSIALRLEYDWQPQATAGFVRGDMADRYIPDMNRVVWPQNTRFGSVLSVGDATHWRVRAQVDSPVSAQTLLGRIDAVISQTPGWHAQPSQGPHHWTRLEGDKRIELSLSSDRAAQGSGYELGANVRVLARGSNSR
jgi:putative intracellular protease/amidase